MRMKKDMKEYVTLAAAILLIGLSICMPSGSLAGSFPKNLKPLAIDESVKVVDANSSEISDHVSNLNDAKKSDKEKADSISQEQDELHKILSYRGSEIFPDSANKLSMMSPTSKPIHDSSSSPLKSIDDEKDFEKIGQTLYREPKETSVKLTKAITGPVHPTFMKDEIVHPVPGKGGKVIASYRFMIPIYIPAMKSKKLSNKLASGELIPDQAHNRLMTTPNNFVKEEHIEMVPVRNEGKPQLKTIYKAERVPQRVITDFVLANGTTLPTDVDDRVKPGEKVIKTVVNDFN